MGALRAAELSPFMVGVGLVYRWYRRFALAADDAVAVQHGPEQLGFVPLTDALIDLRLTFRAAWRQNKIPFELAQKLEISSLALNFRERSLAHVIAKTLPNASSTEINEYHAVLTTSFVRQKHIDALKALDFVRSSKFQVAKTPSKFVMTRAFVNDLEDSGFDIEQLLSFSTSREFT